MKAEMLLVALLSFGASATPDSIAGSAVPTLCFTESARLSPLAGVAADMKKSVDVDLKIAQQGDIYNQTLLIPAENDQTRVSTRVSTI